MSAHRDFLSCRLDSPHMLSGIGFCINNNLKKNQKKAKKKPAHGGQITGFYRGITQGHHTTFDGLTIPNAVYGFVIAR
jgi:hypothetical protein